jgi:DNA modification methylase
LHAIPRPFEIIGAPKDKRKMQIEPNTFICADSIEVLREIKDKAFDLCLTDPPYGVNLGETSGTGGSHGLALKAYRSYVDSYENFCSEIVPRINMAIDKSKRSIVWTGPHIHEQRKPNCIGGVYNPAGCGRHGWGFKTFLPVLFYGTAPDINLGCPHPNTIQSSALAEKCGHPCPKPVEWMVWCILLGSRPGDLVVDPFCGSGTTALACHKTGRKFLCIDKDEEYIKIAQQRYADLIAYQDLFGQNEDGAQNTSEGRGTDVQHPQVEMRLEQ